ncbi:MAG: rubredoxin-like domain-containing protein, partial [Acidobacteriota bacterium]
MAEFRCQQCHAICEDDETPSTCPICGAPGEEAFAARSSVESLFDLEPLSRAPTRPGGEPARLKDRAGSQPSLAELVPLASSPTQEESDAGPLKAASTLELDDSDLSLGVPPPPPTPAPVRPLGNVPTSTGISRLDLLTSGSLSSGLSSLSTLTGAAAAYEAGRETVDLDESDLEQVVNGFAPPPVPPTPEHTKAAVAPPASRADATGPVAT